MCGESSLAQSDDLELFQKSRPPLSLSPFVVELVCAFYFAKGLVVLRVAFSVTLYDAGDADILSLCRGGMFDTNAKGESEH